jgi:hypothetical protein
MNEVSGALREHARLISDQQLRRLEGRMARMDARERLAVDELAHSLAERVAESLLEEARGDPRVAAALESVYS